MVKLFVPPPNGNSVFFSYMPREPLTTLHARSLLGLSFLIFSNLVHLIGRLGLSISLSKGVEWIISTKTIYISKLFYLITCEDSTLIGNDDFWNAKPMNEIILSHFFFITFSLFTLLNGIGMASTHFILTQAWWAPTIPSWTSAIKKRRSKPKHWISKRKPSTLFLLTEVVLNENISQGSKLSFSIFLCTF